MSSQRAPDQTTLDGWLQSQPDLEFQLQLSPDDIGAELVSVLSKGLYTDPFDCIREYVQNGVDADATTVRIKITANSILISDNGAGMDFEALVKARQFGLSYKSIVEDVGFRGIGIYSGFDLCDRLIITSKRAGYPEQNVLTFDFAGMRGALRRTVSSNPRPSLIELLSAYTLFRRDISSGPADGQYTIVDLQNMSADHIRTLSDREHMRRYLLDTIPIDFAPTFEHREAIISTLREEVPGFNPIKVVLEAADGLPPSVIEREPVSGLRTPNFDVLKDDKGKKIALIWSALNTKRSRLYDKDNAPSQAPWRADYEGFVFKIKGFTIGDRNRLQAMFKQPPLYKWYTGEIYVLNPDVVPNAGRDWFETSDATNRLMARVRTALADLEKTASEIQTRGRADDSIQDSLSELAQLEVSWPTAGTIEDRLAIITALGRLDDRVKLQRGKASPEVKKSTTDFEARSKAIKDDFSRHAGGSGTKTESTSSSRPTRGTIRRAPATESRAVPIPSLLQLVARAEIVLDEQGLRVVEAVDASVGEVLGSTGDLKATLMRSVESRLVQPESE